MVISPRRATEAAVRILNEVVKPELQSAHVRSQLTAAVFLLQNALRRWDVLAGVHRDENRALAGLLRRFMRVTGLPPAVRKRATVLKRRLRIELAEVDLKAHDYATTRAANMRLRAWIEAVLAVLSDCLEASPAAARLHRDLRRHMRAEIELEMDLGVESQLAAMSKG